MITSSVLADKIVQDSSADRPIDPDGLEQLLIAAFVPGYASKNPQSQSSLNLRAVKYSQRYKLVFSLLNEDYSQGGVRDWDVAAALQRELEKP